jgi:hypothetical protein
MGGDHGGALGEFLFLLVALLHAALRSGSMWSPSTSCCASNSPS